ncbi:hypothetical protein [Sphingomonas alba]|uniref:Uncharacterized protein n=1 Tax=Sphingomonas alba TaxID=2908208 RepID=A0ABT0RMG8_9SPHN|nr:hypothetical protein [Sphingomonas alba]MCL6683758.1 hypothetical protein [Sphingomonas alba]
MAQQGPISETELIRAAPKRVYLDTQDFSRFGELVRGKPDGQSKELFDYLLSKAGTGEVQFVYSMVTLSELLQYHPDFEATTMARAEAVELLCNGWCCINPSRLLAREAAIALKGSGHDLAVVQSRDNWTPNISNVFEDFDQKLTEIKQSIIAESVGMNRRARRIAEKGASDRAFARMLHEAAPLIAGEYGLSEKGFLGAFLLHHKGKISAEDASKRFFSEVSRPTRFVKIYFEKYDGDKNFPQWISGAGEKLKSGMERTIEGLAALPLDAVKHHWAGLFEGQRQRISAMLLGLAAPELEEFGLSEAELDSLEGNHLVRTMMPIRVYVDLLKAYLAQTIGIHGTKAELERGLAGDLMHSMYAPYVDVWRSDRRFAAVARTVDLGRATVCSRLSELPNLI